MKAVFPAFVLILCSMNVQAQNASAFGNATGQSEPTVDGDESSDHDAIVTGRSQPQEDIFVELWELDQQHNGLSVTLRGSDGQWRDPEAEVRLDEQGQIAADVDRAPAPLIVVHRAEKLQRQTYRSVKRLFDNYSLKDGTAEIVSAAEQREIDNFLDDILQTEVMKRCLQHINSEKLAKDEQQLTAETLKTLLEHQWFELYTNHFRRDSPNPQVCGFEHVFVGDENRGGGIGGHHFWWKFLLDQDAGQADSRGHNYRLPNGIRPPGERYPWLATFHLTWLPEEELLSGSKKGFFVGFSPELMMAYGTLGLLIEQKEGTHRHIALDGGEFELVIHASALPGREPVDERRGTQIRSVFPILKSVSGLANPLSVSKALARPDGETVSVSGMVVREHNNQFGLRLADRNAPDTSLVVKLPPAFRAEYNPLRNAAIVGEEIVVHGVRGRYTDMPAVIEVHKIDR